MQLETYSPGSTPQPTVRDAKLNLHKFSNGGYVPDYELTTPTCHLSMEAKRDIRDMVQEAERVTKLVNGGE
jgi:hypothetical protein